MTPDRRTLVLTLAAATLPLPALAQSATTRLYPDSQFIEKDRFSVEVVGQGPNIVLIPGLASSRETWRATADQLKGRYRVHLVQVAGFAGESPRANASGAVVVPTADAIGAYITEGRLDPAAVIGHSLGGTIALRLAQQQPQTLSKVMLVDTLPFFAGDVGVPLAGIEGMRAQLSSGQVRPQTAAQMEGQIRSMARRADAQQMILGWSRDSDGQVVANAYVENFTLDQRAGLGGVNVPLTLVRPADPAPGQTQEAFDAVYAKAFEAAPRFTAVKIGGANHFVMLDQPQAFAAAVEAFLR